MINCWCGEGAVLYSMNIAACGLASVPGNTLRTFLLFIVILSAGW